MRERRTLPLKKTTVKAWNKKFESLAPRKVIISDSAIEKVLREIGKTKPEHELNCGTCGYDTCREKAMAVIKGKANLAMCLPYLKEKAESFSDAIITNSPNAIIVVNENYDVQLINKAACQLIHITSPGEILGDQVVRILEPMPFIEACQKGRIFMRNAPILLNTGNMWTRRFSMKKNIISLSASCAM